MLQPAGLKEPSWLSSGGVKTGPLLLDKVNELHSTCANSAQQPEQAHSTELKLAGNRGAR